MQGRLAQSPAAVHAAGDVLIKLHHQLLGLPVGHRPHAHHKALGAGLDKGPAQAEHPLAGLDLAHAGLTGREHHHLCAPQLEPQDLFGGHDAFTILGALVI